VWLPHITKCSELLKVAAEYSFADVARELLKIGASVKASKFNDFHNSSPE